MTTSPSHSITLIGLGAMGSALALALLHPPNPSNPQSTEINLTIYNRTSTRPIIPHLAFLGAHLAPSLISALATPADVIVICLISYAAIDSLLASLTAEGDSTVLEGKVVLNLTNGTPLEARTMAQKLKEVYGVKAYLDGAVMATPSMVGHKEMGSQIYVGGAGAAEREVWEGINGWLIEEHWGMACWFGGIGDELGAVGLAGEDAGVDKDGKEAEEDVGAASVQDIANLATMYGLFQGAMVGMALLKRSGKATVDGIRGGKEPAVLPAIQAYVRPLAQNILPLLDHIAKEWDEGIEEGGPHPLGMQLVALDNIVRACEGEGVQAGGLEGFREMIRDAVENGGEGAGEKGLTLVARRFLL